MTHAGARHRIAIYDAAGRDVAHRDLSKGQIFAMLAADVNNDGRDELVVSTEHRLEVLRGDLQQIWSLPQDIHRAGFVYLPLAGATPTLAIQPPEGLDAANGRPRWAGDARPSPYSVFSISLLDPGSAPRLPLFSRRVPGPSATGVPASPDGKFAEPSGTPVPPGLAHDDPHSTRPLPWVGPIERSNALWILLACGGLALLNVVLPLGILRLAAGRRRWSMRVLVALPIAAVVPLMAYLGSRARDRNACESLVRFVQARIPARHHGGHPGGLLRRHRRLGHRSPPLESPGHTRWADAHHVDAVRGGMDRDRQQVDAGDRAIWHIGVVSDRVARRLCKRLARGLWLGHPRCNAAAATLPQPKGG